MHSLVMKILSSLCSPQYRTGGFGLTPYGKSEIEREDFHRLVEELELHHGRFQMYFRTLVGQYVQVKCISTIKQNLVLRDVCVCLQCKSSGKTDLDSKNKTVASSQHILC